MRYNFALLVVLVFSYQAKAMDCRTSCLNQGPTSDCIVFGTQSKFAMKTSIDLMNYFVNPPLINVTFSNCNRQNTVGSNSVLSIGDACTEWSVQPLQDPSNPNDHLEGNYSSFTLPPVLRATFSPLVNQLVFASDESLPSFKAQTDGVVWTANDITSIYEIIWGSERQLVLESDQACYAIIVGDSP